MPRMTRRQAAHWLSPMRECLQHSLTSGEAYVADGYPVWPAVDRCKTTWHRVDWCLAGFRGLIERLFPGLDTGALVALEAQIESQRVMREADIIGALRLLRDVENRLIRLTVAEVQDARMTEEIQIEIDAMGAA